MVVAKLLPYDTHLAPKGHCAFTRRLHEVLPLSLQHALRDRHLPRWLDRAVGASAVALAVRHPRTFVKYLGLKRRGQVFQYGHESAEQTVEIHRCGKVGAPLVVFVHGGAWFSGRPWMYRLIATPLLRQGMDVAIVGYTTYRTLPPVAGTALPDPELEGTADPSVVMGAVDQQVDDLQHCLEFLMKDSRSPYVSSREDGGGVPVFLSGHSSGAHICSLLLLRQALGVPGHDTLPRPVAGMVALAGVFDIDSHHAYEARRGVHEISGMGACNGGPLGFHRNSPTFLAGLLTPAQAAKLPPFLVLHGVEDDTVPFTNSLVFATALLGHGGRVTTAWLPGVDHQGPVTALMLEDGSEVERHMSTFVALESGPGVGMAPRAKL